LAPVALLEEAYSRQEQTPEKRNTTSSGRCCVR